MSIEDRRTDDPMERIIALTRELDELRNLVVGRAGGTVYPNGQQAIGVGAFPDGTHGQRFYDDAGDLLMAEGELPDGSFGLEITSAAYGWDLAKLTTAGWIKPHLMGVSIDPAAVSAVTGGTFQSTVGAYFGEALGPGIEMFCAWSTDVGTTGELQVHSNVGGNTTAQSLPAASSGAFFVRWLHDAIVGTGPFVSTMRARRTAGAGNVNVSQVFGWVQDPAVCTTSGVWIAV